MRSRPWDDEPIALPPRVAILAEARVAMGLRYLCPICMGLDARYPNEGYQLALFPYRLERNPMVNRRP